MRTWIAILTLAVSACTGPDVAVPDGPPAYLALGDSVAFGFDPLVDHRAIEVLAYPDAVGRSRALEVTNAACPGEATGGFISATGNDNHCRENRIAYPLHVAYDGPQLAFAIDFLANHPNTQLVTIDLGGNDISKLADSCALDPVCVLGGFVPMITAYRQNLDLIFGEIRRVYDGPLVALTIYNPFPREQSAQWGLEKINAVLAERVAAVDGVVADGMAAFNAASGGDPCAAGLLIAMPDGTCDVHPSPAGDAVLALEIEAALTRNGDPQK
jgi:lysophospholipase L1-like esterase